MINILLGVGGTGAMVVEAALMLLMSGVDIGLGHTVHVGLIDQDRSNGNIARTRAVLNNILDFRSSWATKGAANVIDWTQDGRPDFGATLIRPLFDDEDNALWCPTQKQGTLRTIVGDNLGDDQRHLFNMLFMEGPEEQDLPLGKGYRGRAHVGATALVAALVEEDNVLLKRLKELMEDAGRQPVNIFIVGSAFGGTGAAGFPTLARALHRIIMAADFKNKDMVSLGGMLMLPYFSFDNPEEGADAVVTPDELLPKARLALEYYENLFAHESTFDRFYALGWEAFFPLGYHEAGSQEQTNPALLPEMLAAGAMVDFFRRDNLAEKEPVVPIMVSARQDKVIKWRDFPVADLEAKFGQMLRFVTYWRYIGEPLLGERTMFGSNWAQKLASGVKAVDSEIPLNALRELIDDILVWAATLEHMGGAFWKEGPWDLSRLLDQAHEATPTKPVLVRESLSGTQPYDAIDNLIRTDGRDFVPRRAAEMHEDLTRSKGAPGGEHQGIGRTVATVYAAATMR